MRSVNNWLRFSLSPHLTGDIPNSSQYQSSGFPIASHSHMPQSSIGFNPADECYGSFSSQMLDLPLRSDGSLCVFDSLAPSHSGADWSLVTHDPTRSMHADGAVQPLHLLSAGLSSFHGTNTDGIRHGNQYDLLSQTNSEQDVPKLEDFLGGASLGGQRTDSREFQTPNLENIYCGHGASFDKGSSCIDSNFPFATSRSRDISPSFHLLDTPDSALPSHYDDQSRDQNLCGMHSDTHKMQAHNLFHMPLDQASHQNFFSDCSLQLPQGSTIVENGNVFGISALRTWLKHAEATSQKTRVVPSNYPKVNLNHSGDLQSLSLSMSPNFQSCVAGIQQPPTCDLFHAESRKRSSNKLRNREPTPRKSLETFGQRTSQYRGVTSHRWTGRYKAHLWDNSCRREGQTRKGRQVYLGGYEKEEKAAKAYDLAALKYWGPTTHINFPLATYDKELEEMKTMSRQEYVASLRRKSSGFSRGASIYRGVTRHHQHGRWQARIGRVAGNKDLYLGTFSTQEEAAEAYDIAAIKFRGVNAVTNFAMSRYDVKRIWAGSSLLVGEFAKRHKENEVNGVDSQTNKVEKALYHPVSNASKNVMGDPEPFNKREQERQLAVYNYQGETDADPLKSASQSFLQSMSQEQQHDNNFADHLDSVSQCFLQSYMPQMAVLHDLIGLDPSTTKARELSLTAGLLQNVSSPTTLVTNSANPSNCSAVETPDNSANEQTIDEGSPKRETPCYSAFEGHFSNPVVFSSSQMGRKMQTSQNYDNSSLSSWMMPPVQIMETKPKTTLGGHLPVFSVWNET